MFFFLSRHILIKGRFFFFPKGNSLKVFYWCSFLVPDGRLVPDNKWLPNDFEIKCLINGLIILDGFYPILIGQGSGVREAVVSS